MVLTLERVAGASDSSGGATTRPEVWAMMFFESPLLDDLDTPASCEEAASCSVAGLVAVDEGWFPMLAEVCGGRQPKKYGRTFRGSRVVAMGHQPI